MTEPRRWIRFGKCMVDAAEVARVRETTGGGAELLDREGGVLHREADCPGIYKRIRRRQLHDSGD